MSVQDGNIIDLIGVNKEGNCILGILDDLAWTQDDKRHLVLQDKINLYLGCLASGEFYEDYPQARGKSVTIRTYFDEEPNDEGKRFLIAVQAAVEKLGVGFEWQLLSDEDRI